MGNRAVGGGREQLLNEEQGSFPGDDNVLEIEKNVGCTTLNALNITALFTSSS